MKKQRFEALFLAVCLLLPGCGKDEPWKKLDDETRTLRNYVNMFAWNVMDTYYLWRDDVQPAMEAWENWEEPIDKVAEVRYKDGKGKDIDRWTMLTDDFSSLQGGVSGHTRTLGMDFQLYYVDKSHARICAVVTYTYADSPAAGAGLKRGDVILKVDGIEMTRDNYQAVARERLLGGGTVRLELSDGRSITLTAVEMYENPVHTACILERPGGRKVGYLHYTSFTLDSCEELVSVFTQFTLAGIDDLVLDLRYNGGGYVLTEKVLASMLVPEKEVEAGSVFSRDIYNATLTEELSDEPACFQTAFTYNSRGVLKSVSTLGSNPDLRRLYVLVSGSSASASESLICGLKPYMDIILIGEQTSGKYCGGVLLSAPDWLDSVKKGLEEGEYDKALPWLENWGIYVMVSRYADCNGVTLSMPDGIAPDVEAEDKPRDGYALGDPDETMLSVALALMEGRTRSAERATGPSLEPVADGFHPRTTGLRVAIPTPLRVSE